MSLRFLFVVGNGFITLNEFEKFIERLGVKMTQEEVSLVFKVRFSSLIKTTTIYQ